MDIAITKHYMKVIGPPNPDLECTNYAYCARIDLEKFRIEKKEWRSKKLFLAAFPDDSLIVSLKEDSSIQSNSIALNSSQLQTASVCIGSYLSLGKFIPPDKFKLKIVILDLESSNSHTEIDAVQLGDELHREFHYHVLTVGQKLLITFNGVEYDVNVVGALLNGQNHCKTMIKRGLITSKTKFMFKVPTDGIGNITIINQKEVTSRIPLRLQTNLQSIGIGGLKEPCLQLYSEVFHPRSFPPELSNNRHVRGALLYGGSGNGKSLLGRKIAEMFGTMGEYIMCANFCKISGKAEKRVLKQFLLNAQSDQRAYGIHSQLRVLVLDEFDFIARPKWKFEKEKTVVKRILKLIDGWQDEEDLNNVIFIAITNKKEAIDRVLLTRDSLEVHIELKDPNKQERLEFLQLCVHETISPDWLDSDVDLEKIADGTKNFNGTMVELVVRNALWKAMNSKEKSLKINHDDFANAIYQVADWNRRERLFERKQK